MKALFAICTLFCFLSLPSLVAAHPKHGKHYHRHTHSSSVVVSRHSRRKVVLSSASSSSRTHRHNELENEEIFTPLSVGLRLSGVGMEGHTLFLSDFENPAMAGLGAHLRTQIADGLSLQLSADALIGQKKSYTQIQIPIALSVLYHFLPHSRLQPYLLAGTGIQMTQLRYLDGAFKHNFNEALGQVGAGLELWLTKKLSFGTDVRLLGFYKDLGSRSEIASSCEGSAASQSGFCSKISSIDTNDHFNGGIQFMAGFSYRF